MSRDIVLVCEDCKESIWIGEVREQGIALYTQQPECMRELATFLAQHHGHMLSSGGSHDCDGYAEMGWDVAFPAQELPPSFWLFAVIFCGTCVGVGMLLYNRAVALGLWPWLFGQ